jgi:hypothetical protein
MGEIREQYAKWNKMGTERQLPHALTYKCNKKTITRVEQRLGGRVMGKYWSKYAKPQVPE